MKSNENYIKYYIDEVKKGKIQKGYKEIINSISFIKRTLENNYPDYINSSLYLGYMDMTYFSLTPKQLKDKKLKIAIVYLHQENRFEIWLSGLNKNIQKKYIENIKNMNISDYKLSNGGPGVDSIIEYILDNNPNFYDDKLIVVIETKVQKFIDDITRLI